MFLENTYRRNGIVLAALLVLLIWAWHNRFVQDDAFISMRYARNLAQGHGLVWNPGEKPVEGYTNFLWVLILALPHLAGVSVVSFVHVAGLLLLSCTLLATHALARILTRSPSWTLITMVLVGADFTFSSYATSGMETQLLACLLTMSALLVASAWEKNRWNLRRSVALGFAAALSILTRIDSVVALVPIMLVPCLIDDRESPLSRKRVRTLIAGIAIPGLITGIWFLWKHHFYGSILPNTFALKTQGPTIFRGFFYVTLFLLIHGYVLAVPILYKTLKGRLEQSFRRALPALPLAVAVLLWIAYTIIIGGDFMDFRFLMPVLPLGAALAIWSFQEGVQSPSRRRVLTLLLFLAAILPRFYPVSPGVSTIHLLRAQLKEEGWEEIGRELGQALGRDPGVCIAVGPSGAIPYYSDLRSIDMLGLNDPWVARNGIPVRDVANPLLGPRPGHVRVAPLRYVYARGCNLVVGHPYITDQLPRPDTRFRLDEIEWWGGPQFLLRDAPADLLRDARVVFMPLSGGRFLQMLYLRPNETVDRLVRDGAWSGYDLELPASGGL